MEIIIIFAAMIMVYIYFTTLYFYKRTKENQKRKSNLIIRGITYFRRENFEQAHYYFELAYDESVKLNDVHLAAESLYYLALIHNKKGRKEAALDCIKDSLDYYQHVEDPEGIQKAEDLKMKI
ncbi:MAG: tetratricopeptide repeat protein [Methanomicrobiales archaeon]